MPEYFEVPAKLSIPVLATSRVNFKVSSKEDHETVNMTGNENLNIHLELKLVLFVL